MTALRTSPSRRLVRIAAIMMPVAPAMRREVEGPSAGGSGAVAIAMMRLLYRAETTGVKSWRGGRGVSVSRPDELEILTTFFRNPEKMRACRVAHVATRGVGHEIAS